MRRNSRPAAARGFGGVARQPPASGGNHLWPAWPRMGAMADLGRSWGEGGMGAGRGWWPT
jgi:hypothetical protein